MNRHLAYLVFIMLAGWLAGMIIHYYQSQPASSVPVVASQKIG